MPPPNDSWQTATALVGEWPRQNGTNVDATDDEGGRAAVWYRWLNVPTGPAWRMLSTRPGLFGGGLQFRTEFDTHLKVFRANVFGGVPELGDMLYSTDLADRENIFAQPRTTWARSYGDFAFWGRESELLFPRAGNTNIYLAVSSAGAATGRFHLSQRVADWRRFLSARCIERGADYTAVAQAALPHVDGPSTTRFISADGIEQHPAGSYRIKYCGGAFRHDITSAFADWVTVTNRTNSHSAVGFADADGVKRYFIRFNYATNQGVAHAFLPGRLGSASQFLAERALRCQKTDFFHAGGPIELQFVDDAYSDNLPGTALPAFTLYRRNDSARFRIHSYIPISGAGLAGAQVLLQNMSPLPQNNVRGVVFDAHGRAGFFPGPLLALGNYGPGDISDQAQGRSGLTVSFALPPNVPQRPMFFTLKLVVGDYEQYLHGYVTEY